MKKILLLFILLSLTVSCAWAQSLTVVAAASLRFAMEDMAKEFEQVHPGSKIEIVFSSSGKAYAQITNGAPFDLFFSADMHYPERLHAEGYAIDEVKQYAVGRLVIWQRRGGPVDLNKGIAGLDHPVVQRLAIANPELAPYGAAAKEALIDQDLWEKLTPRMVMGENISQTAHFAASGAAQAGLIAYALALSDDMQRIGEFALVDESIHTPMPLGFVILKSAKNIPLAQKFGAFVLNPEGKAVLSRYGF
ncbi:molybdate ABC transporter substrate-binding protein [Pelovirga terrestris]|uniref:Molybdate ABC transporter substrate-binding protein n=1 Tax=Pelovirga terrestris TaxID=2771352 RepID=A0A8J6QNP2_9BACT|nr:molybdate ABC transporter substrate-binding protein [Pelovirga terrestris]